MSLKGKKIKDGYKQILILDNTQIDKKDVTDGDGGATGLALSPIAAYVKKLFINNASSLGSSKALVLDNQTGEVGVREFPNIKPSKLSVSGSVNPTLQVDNGFGGSTSVQFVGTEGASVIKSGETILIKAAAPAVMLITSTATLATTDAGKTILIDANSLAGGVVRLPQPVAGMKFTIKIDVSSTTAFTIVTDDQGGSSQDRYFYGKVHLSSTTDTNTQTQIVARATASTTEASYDTLTIDSNATATGGLAGDTIELVAYDSNGWLVSAALTTSGTPVTPTTIGT
jgi:hypothetical protein